MATCLGIYIGKNIIKYAKVTKDKTSTKIDAFGVEIYTNLKETIDKIVEETFSFKIPISINLSEEIYNYFNMSDLLSKKDLQKAIKTEFESYCYDKNLNPNALESRYSLVNNIEDKEKIRVIHTSVDKIKLNKIVSDLEGKRVNTIVPLPIAIANVVPLNSKENIAIVNIEDTTTVTIVNGEKVYDVSKVNVGMEQILENVNEKENSYKKAYDICKDTTIYTMQGRELQEKDNEYLSDIVPTLYEIATQVKNILSNSLIKISKIYLTGTGTIINNIDLYFEELLNNTKCEILKPFFIEDSPKINMKDYIEVNSAISLALQGVGFGVQNINFSHEKNKLSNIITISGRKNEEQKQNSIMSKLNSINISNSAISKWLIRVTSASAVLMISYIAISAFITMQISKKQDELSEIQNFTNKQISQIKADTNNVNNKITEYNTLTKNLQDASNALSEKNSLKNVIPTLLSQIIKIIPQGVQLTAIENTSGKKVTINAQSSKYEQLAYFKAKLRSEGILEPTSVVSTQATKEGDTVKIVIEGELP